MKASRKRLDALDIEVADKAAQMLTDIDAVPADEAWLLMREVRGVSVAAEESDPHGLGLASNDTLRLYVAARLNLLRRSSSIRNNVVCFATERKRRMA